MSANVRSYSELSNQYANEMVFNSVKLIFISFGDMIESKSCHEMKARNQLFTRILNYVHL